MSQKTQQKGKNFRHFLGSHATKQAANPRTSCTSFTSYGNETNVRPRPRRHGDVFARKCGRVGSVGSDGSGIGPDSLWFAPLTGALAPGAPASPGIERVPVGAIHTGYAEREISLAGSLFVRLIRGQSEPFRFIFQSR